MEISQEAVKPIKMYFAFKNKHELSLAQFQEVVDLMPFEEYNDYSCLKQGTDYISHIAVYKKNNKYFYDFVLDESMRNLCTVCGIDMGIDNPRQLCGKLYCCNSEMRYED